MRPLLESKFAISFLPVSFSITVPETFSGSCLLTFTESGRSKVSTRGTSSAALKNSLFWKKGSGSTTLPEHSTVMKPRPLMFLTGNLSNSVLSGENLLANWTKVLKLPLNFLRTEAETGTSLNSNSAGPMSPPLINLSELYCAIGVAPCTIKT